MGTVHPVRALAALAILLTVGACADNFSPAPSSPGVADLTLVPRIATIGTGQTVVLTALLIDEFGNSLVNARVAWSSNNEKIATVNPNGTVVGRSEGRASITASSHGRTQSSAIQVTGGETKGKPGRQLPP